MTSQSMGTVAVAAEEGRRPAWQGILSITPDLLLVVVFVLFTFTHGHRVFVEGIYTAAPFALINLTYALLFLTRRRSQATSSRWQDWLVATIGGWLPFFCRPENPSGQVLAITGTSIQIAGLAVAVICLTSLGRSFGIVAADRGLKTGGAYAVVRHPIYAAHLVTQAGFLMANPSTFNAGILVVVAVAQVLRIAAEERLLETSSDYSSYRESVRYRLIPGLY